MAHLRWLMKAFRAIVKRSGRERRVVAERRRRLRELEPGLLRDVLGGVASAAQAEQKREDAQVGRGRTRGRTPGSVAPAKVVDQRPLDLVRVVRHVRHVIENGLTARRVTNKNGSEKVVTRGALSPAS